MSVDAHERLCSGGPAHHPECPRGAEPDQPFSPLVADILSAQVAMTADTTNALIETLQRQLADAHAREAAVEAGIERLLDGPYAPSESAIRRALYPTPSFVDQFRQSEVA